MLVLSGLFFGPNRAHSGNAVAPSASAPSPIGAPSASSQSHRVERQVAENQPAGTAIGAPVALADPIGRVTYALGGSDAAIFSIDTASGQLRTTGSLDYEGRHRYVVTVTATDDKGPNLFTVPIVVTDVEEPGVLTFAPSTMRAGTVIRGRFNDPDGGVVHRETIWRWSVSVGDDRDGRYTEVAAGIPGTLPGKGVEAATFTPASEHAGRYLKVSVQYSDRRSPKAFGLEKRVVWISDAPIAPAEAPQPLTVRTLVSGLTIPWDIAFTPDGTMLFTERGGQLRARFPDGRLRTVSADFSDIHTHHFVGLMSLAVDPDFADNRRFYTCQGHMGAGTEVQVIGWTMDASYTGATRVDDPLIGGIAFKDSGWHAGCRIRFGPDGYLWITTGDGQIHHTAQDVNSLAGKILRVNAQTGLGAPDNPFTDPNDSSRKTRVYSYGHRNPQGLAFRPRSDQVWAVGHGPDYDDEINLIEGGGNYGWNPKWRYNEYVPMTDLDAFPNAIEAKWQSGYAAIAPSGAVFLDGAQWGAWNGRLAVAVLKQQYLKVFEFADDGTWISEITAPELDQHYGRLRSPVLGPDGALYITTSNGSGDDRILQVFGPAAPRLDGPNTVTYHHLGTDPVATFSAHNMDASVTWTLSGQDAAAFDISATGVLSFRASPSLNAPFDADTDSIYHVLITAGNGSRTARRAVTVTVAHSTPVVSVTAGGGVTEGGDATFTVTANPAPRSPLNVGVTITQSGDYGVSTGARTVTIPTSGSYTLTAATSDDSLDEADGSVTATVNTGTGYTVSSSSSAATVAVTDDDMPELSITAGDDVTEGGDATFTITANPAPHTTLPVSVTVSQSGDYGATTGAQTVTMPTSGSYTFTVSTTSDSQDEPDGSVTAALNSGSGYTVSSISGAGTVAVTDDDPPPVCTPNLPADAVTVDEVTGWRDKHSHNADHVKRWNEVLAALGEDTGETPLTVAGSRANENRFIRSLWNRVTRTLEAIEQCANQPQPEPVVSVTAGGGVTEGGDATFTVTANPAPRSPLNVGVTITQSGDYGVSTGARTVTIPTSGSYTLTAATSDDSLDEADGSVTATVNTGTGYTVSSSSSAATVAVTDDDPPPAQPDGVSISVSDARAREDAGTIEFVVTLSAASEEEVTVQFTTALGTATWHLDYEDYHDRVTFAPRETQQVVSVTLVDDDEKEWDETIWVWLNSPTGGATLGDRHGEGVIADDD
ncbi:MAG: hypothetical protein F4176_12060 [Acidimicrobiia bacterium]|nr:hypothetical protein [Acidimicrobiia bacterium]